MKGFILFLLCMAGSLAIHAQAPTPSQTRMPDSSKVSYTCTMHPEIITHQPGKCPKCGMSLVKVIPKSYTCSMHPDVVSNKPGKCPKCKMTLVEKKPKAKVGDHDH